LVERLATGSESSEETSPDATAFVRSEEASTKRSKVIPVPATNGRMRPRRGVLLVIGTRPEAIKMATIALALRTRDDEFETVLCSTGQHREMLHQALAAFGLRPDLDLDLMQPQQSLADLSARALTALDATISRLRPDLVVVQGDTTSAMVGALAAYYQQVPVAHLEAGLRTGDLLQPFPEEGNRRLIGALATLHFAPTSLAARKLRQEGVPTSSIFVTGNPVIDALLKTREKVRHTLPVGIIAEAGRRLVLLTMHRRESFGLPLENLCRAVLQLVERNPDIEVVFPVHASPFVREPVQRLLGCHPRIQLIQPLSYLDFVRVLDACYFILTDSGGVQEEAPALGKPVLVLREKTERPESIKTGTSRLVGTDPRQLLTAAEELLHDEPTYRAMAHATNPYGDGRAAERVLSALRWHFGLTIDPPVPFAPSFVERANKELIA
jgi:UDP-N-acetylglucosamine 2-epimerase (non-hydrolysing)